MVLLATDLDGTFLGGKQEHRLQLYNAINHCPDIRLVFVTGRGLETVIPLLDDPVIPNPDYIICDVGATVVNGSTLEPVQPLQRTIEKKWPGSLVTGRKLNKVRGLFRQEVPQSRRSSFYFDDKTDIDHLHKAAASLNCDVLLSAGRYADVLPKDVNKGTTLVQLVKLLRFPADKILVAGDTLNDLSLYKTGYKGVVVGEAEAGLLGATRGMPNVYTAGSAGAGGITEAFEHFNTFGY
jgi:hydroxymethylpyrimidine pyrophosphatase-like HAD family hydrolase